MRRVAFFGRRAYANGAMDIKDRIAQWEKMTAEAPDDMAFFSLGGAYKDAERYADAEAAFAKAIEHNAEMSRAYQLRGQMLMKLDRADEAAAVLTEGYTIAAKRGDVMPQKAMGSLLETLGRPVPQVETADTPDAETLGENQIIDRKTGQPGTRLADPPMRGPLGQFIYDHFSQQTWTAWIHQGTKVINELRLDFSNPEHQRVYDQQMMEWLGITQDEVDAHASEKSTSG